MLNTSINGKILRVNPSRTIIDSFEDNLTHDADNFSKNRSAIKQAKRAQNEKQLTKFVIEKNSGMLLHFHCCN